MRRNILVLLLSAIAIVSSVSGATYYQLYYPGEYTIDTSPELSAYLDGLPWSNGTLIQWGVLEPGWDYSKNLTVVNTGNTLQTVDLIVSGLEPGHNLTWAGTGTLLEPGDSIAGNLLLEIPSNATGKTYPYSQWIRGS